MAFGRRRVIREVVSQFPAEESQLDGIRRFVQESCRGTPLSTKDVNSVLLALEEACTNVIRHAYLYGHGTIRLHIALAGDRVTFSIYDKGRSFDFDRAGAPDLGRYVETGRKGGLGIYLIRKIMDEVEYRTIGDENRLRMVKLLPKARTAVAPTRGISIRVKFSLFASLVVLAIVSGVYFYFDQRFTSNSEKRSTEELKRLSASVATTSANYIRNKRSDVEFDELVHQSAKDVEGLRELVITNRSGTVLASAVSPERMHSAYETPSGKPWAKDTTIVRVPSTEGPRLYVVAPIDGGGKVIVAMAESVIALNVAKARQGALVIAVVGLVVGMLSVYFLSLYFVKPIQKLTEGVRRIGLGDLDTTLPVDGDDEFGQIAHAFNEMTVKFKKAQESRVEQERMHKEMQVAQEIQHALLPAAFPEIEGYDLATIYQAAKDVGGDYFDFVWIDDNTLGIVVADVSGKGVPGSLVMTMIRTAIRLEARGNKNAVDILKRVNDFVSDDVKRGMFVTIFLVVLDAEQRRISFASAGHNPLVLYRASDRKTYFLNPKGIPLGMQLPEGVNFGGKLEADSVRLHKDDLLVIYTDGVTEAMNPRRDQYGMDRFLNFIRDHADRSADDFVACLEEDLAKFTGNAPQNDDITLVAIKEEVALDEVVYKRRRQLIDLVDKQGLSVKEASERMGVSTSTYYKYKRRFDHEGASGLLDRRSRSQQGARQLSVDERACLLKVVVENPDWGATRLRRQLALPENGSLDIDDRAIYEELVRLRVNTKELRIAYALRHGHKNPEELTARLEAMKRSAAASQAAPNDAEQMEESYKAEASQRVARVMDRMDRAAADSGLHEVDRQLLQEVVDELAPVAEGEMLADFVTRMVNKLAGNTSVRRVDQGPVVLDWQRWDDSAREGFEKLKETGLDLPDDPKPDPDDAGTSLDDIVRKREGRES
jgi:serine phosphatase RsbU (regulator of sigma subunit)/anti-sigma regulatory factor (Ser/Thr protein kinase)/transposase